MADLLSGLRGAVPERTKIEIKRAVSKAFPRNLELLGLIFRTDKSSRAHNYTAVYRELLAPRRRKIRRMLEIGIGGYENPDGGGQSLRMWRAYLPRAEVIGADLHPKRFHAPGVILETCDQGDPQTLVELALRRGPFDLVIDDGSHIASHVVATFEVLYDHVLDGGLYIIEDTHTAYLEEFGGGPPGTAGTSLDLAKSLLDRIHLRDDVAELRVHRGLVIVLKGASVTA